MYQKNRVLSITSEQISISPEIIEKIDQYLVQPGLGDMLGVLSHHMKGSYLLITRLAKGRYIKVGRLGEIYFSAGWYAYVGSAMGGLESRIAYHLRKHKKLHWHVDYLLQEARINRVMEFESEVRIECAIAEALAKQFVGVPRFGRSDCKCQSHLYYAQNKEEFYSENLSLKLQ